MLESTLKRSDCCGNHFANLQWKYSNRVFRETRYQAPANNNEVKVDFGKSRECCDYRDYRHRYDLGLARTILYFS